MPTRSRHTWLILVLIFLSAVFSSSEATLVAQVLGTPLRSLIVPWFAGLYPTIDVGRLKSENDRLEQLLNKIERKIASAEPRRQLTQEELLKRSVRIFVDDAVGRLYGTGTVIRSVPGETIVLTCGHLYGSSAKSTKTTVEFFGSDSRVKLIGELIDKNSEADVALVRVKSEETFPVAPIADRKFVPAPGQFAQSVGCDNGKNPTIRKMRITAVDRYLGEPTIECSGEPVEGRSGGGLFNEAGEVIGVCSAREPSEHRGIYSGLKAIHTFLDKNNLGSLIKSN